MRRRILLVEDSRTYAQYLQIFLAPLCEELKFEIVHVTRRSEADRALPVVDGVILDAMLEDSRHESSWQDTCDLWSNYLPVVVHSSRQGLSHGEALIIPKYGSVSEILEQFRGWLKSIYGEVP